MHFKWVYIGKETTFPVWSRDRGELSKGPDQGRTQPNQTFHAFDLKFEPEGGEAGGIVARVPPAVGEEGLRDWFVTRHETYSRSC